MWNWANIQSISSRSYVCGHCNRALASEKGYQAIASGRVQGNIYICHFCNKPTFLSAKGEQVPGDKYGEDVQNISDQDVNKLYEEARSAYSANAYTAVAMCCRTILMHIAVAKGAKKGQSFEYYVNYLDNENYIPQGAKGWVTFLRKQGNKAVHKIIIEEKERAQKLLKFTAMLLKVVYEYPSEVEEKEIAEAAQ